MHIGDKIGKYELLYPIGEGGMGEVWVGRLRSLGGFESYVAIKVIHGRFAKEKRFRDMFLDEARVSAQISHPNVVSTQDVAVEGEMLYQIMEYVDGDSLAGLQSAMAEREERMPLPVALRIAADVCAGLHAAHELRSPDGRPRGIVHRDVSPQNILLGANGAVKLIDFGVALMQDRLAEDSQGSLKGKLRYMPQEQATGTKVDRRADIYALGAVLYEMISGYLPFDDRTEAVYFRALIQGDAPAPLPNEIPEDVRAVVFKAMAVDKEDRYPTAEAMGDDLAAILRRRPANIASFVEIHLSNHAQRRRSAIKQSAAEAGGETSPAIPSEPMTEQNPVPDESMVGRAPANSPGHDSARRLEVPAGARVVVVPASGPDVNRDISLSLAHSVPQSSMELSTVDFLSDTNAASAAASDPGPALQEGPMLALPEVPSLDLDLPPPARPAPRAEAPKPRPPPAELTLADTHSPTTEASDEPTRARTRPHARPPARDPGAREPRFVTGTSGAFPERRETKRGFGRVLIVLGVLASIVVAGVLALPAVAKHRVKKAAAERGLEIEIEEASVDFAGIDLRRVHATGPGLPLKTATATHVHISYSWNVGIKGLTVSMLGPAKELPAALDKLGAPSSGTYEVDVTEVELEWREPFGKDTVIEAKEAKLGMAHEEGSPEVRSLRAYTPEIFLRSSRGKAGPFTLNIDESEARKRARLVFEPRKADGPNVFFIYGGQTATSHLTTRIPRSKLSALHVPAAYLGLPAGEDPILEITSGIAFEPDGRVKGEGRVVIAGLAVAGNRAKTPLDLDFSLIGEAGKPVEISRGVATYGPINADFGGRFTRDPLRGEVRFTTKPLACASFVGAEARKSLGAVGGLAVELFERVVPVTGTVNVKGTFTFEPTSLESAKLKFEVRDTCGVALFTP